MRLFVLLGVSLACCWLWSARGAEAKFTPVALDKSGISCEGIVPGVLVPSLDGCHNCMCEGDLLMCNYTACTAVTCHEELQIGEPGQCCPSCREGCYTEEFGYHKKGDAVPNKDPCKICSCVADVEEISCEITVCDECLGTRKDDGTCCGTCEPQQEEEMEGPGYTLTALNVSGISCSDYASGEPIMSNDYCHFCSCNGDKIECSYMDCGLPPFCHEKLLYIPEQIGMCCPSCKEGCYTDEFGVMEPNQDVTSEDGCKTCVCHYYEVLICTTEECLPCEGSHWEDDGSCCGKCDLTTCKVDGVVYNNDDNIPNDDPCKTCYCRANGLHVEAMCNTTICSPCQGTSNHKDDGTCCGTCEPQQEEEEGPGYTLKALDVSGFSCPDYGSDEFMSNDQCHVCSCNGDKMECSYNDCTHAPPLCHETLQYIPEGIGRCCPRCKEGCYTDEFGVMERNQDVTSEDGCKTCVCDYHGELTCTTEECLPCEGSHWEDDGSCCGKCDLTTCKVDGVVYNNGDTVTGEDPCQACSCVANGYETLIMCNPVMCDVCPGITTDDGRCCGSCEIPRCRHRRKLFEIGETIPMTDPCATCICTLTDIGAEATCAYAACEPCQGKYINDGSCCGQCIPACNVRGQLYEIVPAQDMCCPQCKCRHGKNIVNPGPFGDVCDGCVCDGFGKVTCNPVVCPKKESLECVDAVMGEDCCYHCPNGKTCAHPMYPNVVIKYGEYRKVKSSYCECAGEPWFPTAFCTRERKTKGLQRARRKYGDKLADYMKL